MTQVAAGFLLGLAGSMHCLAMCGPLALIASRRPRAAVVHHASRIGMYTVLGALAGAAGGTVAAAGWARALALVAGVLLIAQGLQVFKIFKTRFRYLPGRFGAIARRLPDHPLARAAVLGAANGLMPCGLLYAALIAAAGLGDTRDAVAFVAGFGIGSLPVFAGLTFSGTLVRSTSPRLIRRVTPVAIALAGLMLIARAWPLPAGAAGEGHSHPVHSRHMP